MIRCFASEYSIELNFNAFVDGPGLQDPCESKPVDLFKDLTDQQKENITCYAQVFYLFNDDCLVNKLLKVILLHRCSCISLNRNA